MLHPLTQKVDVSMNATGNMNSLMKCFSDLSGVKKGLLKGNIGKGLSMDGLEKDEMPFLQMLKESFLSTSKNKVLAMEKKHLTKQKGFRIHDDTVKNNSSLKKKELSALFCALAGLSKNGLDKETGTIFWTKDGGKENTATLLIPHRLQRGGINNAILAERNGREISVQDVKILINNIIEGFEGVRSGSEAGFVPGKSKQAIVDILKGFGFNEEEIKGILSTDKNEGKQNELAVRKESDVGRDTGKKLFDVKTEKLSAAFKEIVKEFREPRSQHGNTSPLATGKESEDMKKSMTAMKSNGSEGTKTEMINAEMKQTAKVPKAGLNAAMAALNATGKDNPEEMRKRGHVLSGKVSIDTNDKTTFLKAANTQGQGKKEGYTKFVNESGMKNVATTKMEDSLKEGRLLHRSEGGNHVTVSHGSMPSSNANDSRSAVAMNPRVVINQVVNTAGGKLSKGFERIRIELNPPHLGTVDMDVLVRNGKVQVILQTENYDVKHLLQSNTEQLKTSLQTQGLIADTISVSVQEKSDGNHYEYGQNGTLYQEMSDRGSDRDNQEELHDSVGDDLFLQPEGESNISPNGRISLFA